MKPKRLTNFKFSYVVLISNFIKHFGVDVEGELEESTGLLNHVSILNMHKMRSPSWATHGWLKESKRQTLKLEKMTMKRAQVEQTKEKMIHIPWQLRFINLLTTLDLYIPSLRGWFSTNFKI